MKSAMIIFVCMATVWSFALAYFSGYCGENVTWFLYIRTLQISGNGEMDSYQNDTEVPWYHYRSTLRAVTIEKGVTTIGQFAFYKCDGIENVTIPDSVVSIEDSAFSYCSSLNSVIIPDSVVSIGETAFQECTSLASVTIPDSIISIGKKAFDSCSSLKSVYYQGTQDFDSSIFQKCETLNLVCVSPDYALDTFCGERISSSCKTFQGMFNHCYKGAYINNEFVSEKRTNASEWENRTNLCMSYLCDNSSGAVKIPLMSCVDGPACYNSNGTCNEDSEECEYERKSGWDAENECYEVKCDGSEWILEKKENATKWEDRTNGCFEYQCDNESGLVVKNLCEMGNICVEDLCVDETIMKKEGTSVVEIELRDDIHVSDVNLTDLVAQLSELCKTSLDQMTVGYETDAEGFSVRLLLYSDEESIAETIVNAVLELNEEGCSYGVLCHTKRVFVKNESNVISSGLPISSGCRRGVSFVCLFVGFTIQTMNQLNWN